MPPKAVVYYVLSYAVTSTLAVLGNLCMGRVQPPLIYPEAGSSILRRAYQTRGGIISPKAGPSVIPKRAHLSASGGGPMACSVVDKNPSIRLVTSSF